MLVSVTPQALQNMYNKLFTKILDSSIWLAPDPHRLVWITLLAAMDEDSNAMFACAQNLAARARVSVKAAEAAISAFESPDPNSGDPEYEGRRIERIPGGWFILNGPKYRELVTKSISRERTKERVRRWREKRGNGDVTDCNADVTPSNDKDATRNAHVTPSEAVSEAVSRSEASKSQMGSRARPARKRCPEEFQVTEDLRTWAAKNAPGVNLDTQTASFRDYEFRNGKTDWPAAWRNWMRKATPKTSVPLADRLTWRPSEEDEHVPE